MARDTAKQVLEYIMSSMLSFFLLPNDRIANKPTNMDYARQCCACCLQ